MTLHHLSSAEAVKLLSPYSQTPGGGVYEVSRVHAITIRETPKIYADMMAVLTQFDRERANVTLNWWDAGHEFARGEVERAAEWLEGAERVAG